jgi:tetratricopeptide (TPR) repeat protein
MRRLGFVRTLVGSLLLSVLLAGCGPNAPGLPPALPPATTLPAGASGTAIAPPVAPGTAPAATEAITTTPVPAPRQTVNQAFDALKAALEGYQNGGDDGGKVIAATSDAASALLAGSGAPTPASAETLSARLEALLPGGQKPITALADFDGDGQPDCLLATPGMFDFPALIFLSTDSYGSRQLPPNEKADGYNDDLLPAAWPSGAQALDVTGDGQPEALVTFRLPGGSGVTDRVHAFQWSAGQRTFVEVFRATLVTWAGPSTWKMQPGPAGSQEFVLNGPAFGVFDHKLLAHPSATQVWRWAPGAGRFVKASESITPPQNQRQAVNQGEALLRLGDYAQAIRSYRAAVEDKTLAGRPETDHAPDWAAFAMLRLGQTYALAGQEAEARAVLQQTVARGGNIGQLAGAFLEAYRGAPTVTNAWGAFMKALDLNEMLYQDKAGNLGFPMGTFSIYYPGLAVAAYLDTHPQAVVAAAGSLQAELWAAGITLDSLRVADIDGNGDKEVVFVTPDRAGPDQLLEHAWLAHKQGGRWRVEVLAEGPQLTLEQAVPLATKGEMIAIRYPEGFEPPLVGYLWRNGAIARYDLTGGAATLLPDDDWPIIGE